MLVVLHNDPVAAELHSFQFQTKALFVSVFGFGLDLAARADDALPRHQAVTMAEEPGGGSMVERVAGSSGYLSIGGDFTRGNREDDAAHGFVAREVWPYGLLLEAPAEFGVHA